MSAETPHISLPPNGLVRDVIQWRRKTLSLTVVLVATAIYVSQEVYGFNLITVASWAAMSIVASMFLWGNIIRLLGKESPSPSLSRQLEITEESTAATASSLREWREEGVRWMFRVGAEKEWYVFDASVAALALLSILGTHFDMQAFLCIGTMLGMTAPIMYRKYEYKLRECWERLRVQIARLYQMFDQKVIGKLRTKFGWGEKKKEKKTE